MSKEEAARKIRNMAAKVATLSAIYADGNEMFLVDLATIEANLIKIADDLLKDD